MTQIHKLSDNYSVAPQISTDDVVEIANAGFKTIICNRPDDENPEHLSISAIQQAAVACGLNFFDNPFNAHNFSQSHIEKQSEIMASENGPILAYCASGNRCSIIWAFGMARQMPVEDILMAAETAGYHLGYLKTALLNFSNQD